MTTLFAAGVHPTPNTSDEQKIVEVVQNFAKFGDEQNVEAMDNILDAGYRSVLNRLFNSNEVRFLDKATYLGMLRDKKLGGDKRTVTMLLMDINVNNAMVKVEFAGSKMTLITFLLLAKNEASAWRIVTDMPNVK